ncbi:MAG: hypothetical protein JSV21_01580 [Nitrospirota bacterium]|nr:MAG: hypothetical protein JSV21_01580 [Nitrospirota bacterium]
MPDSNDDEKIVHVFERRSQKMDPGEAFNLTPFIITIVACVVIAVVSIVVGYAVNKVKQQKIIYMEEKIGFLEKRTALLQEKADIADMVLSYSGKLRISDIKIKRSEKGTNVLGVIQNTGKRQISDLEVTVYFLDNKDTFVGSKTITDVLHGPGLKRGQTRNFSLDIGTLPDVASGIVPVVSSFAER